MHIYILENKSGTYMTSHIFDVKIIFLTLQYNVDLK